MKVLRLHEDFPRRIAIEEVCRSRVKRRDVRFEAENICKELEHYHTPFEFLVLKNWESALEKFLFFFPSLSGA